MKTHIAYISIIIQIIGFVALNELASGSDSRPNIIYIMADDLGFGELGCYGQSKIKTPEIDRMASAGMRFTQHYAGTAVCAPTRCSLMTGLHTGHCYIRANSPGYPNAQFPMPNGTETIATMLKRAGYQTACIGKWGLGNHNNSGCALEQGFDHFYGYYDQRHAHNYFTDHLYRNRERIELDGKTYSHDLLTEESLEFLETNHSKPFFLYVPYCVPHTKFQVPELGQYSDENWKQEHKIHAAMIGRMDRDIGRLIKKIEELGLSSNTLIMFTSDHGAHGISGTAKFFKSSGRLRGVKRSLYEGGIRVPLIALWPGKIQAGSQSNLVSAFWDMMPTLSDLCGAETKSSVDGISMVPELLDQQTSNNSKKRMHLYWELFEGRKHNRAVRYGKWKGVIANYYKNQSLELYDLDADESETTNVAAANPGVVKKLLDLMEASRTRSEFWNVHSKGFDLVAACKATGIDLPKQKKRKKSN